VRKVSRFDNGYLRFGPIYTNLVISVTDCKTETEGALHSHCANREPCAVICKPQITLVRLTPNHRQSLHVCSHFTSSPFCSSQITNLGKHWKLAALCDPVSFAMTPMHRYLWRSPRTRLIYLLFCTVFFQFCFLVYFRCCICCFRLGF